MTQEQQLTSLLNSEVTCLQVLLDTLNDEFNALTSSNVDALEQITLDKNNALAKQAEATLSRQHFVTAETHDNTDKGLQQLLSGYQTQQALSNTLLQLRSLAEQCQNLNRTNGRLILQKQQHTRNALDILRQADSNPSTYSGQGDTITSGEGRSLGKA
jgi:flagella synthesis protein FlgN